MRIEFFFLTMESFKKMFRNSSHSNEALVELIETAFVYSSRVFYAMECGE